MSKTFDPMRVSNLVIYRCARVRIQADPENGCIDIFCFDSKDDHWTSFRLLVYGPDDTVPGIDLAEPAKPDPEEQVEELEL